MARIVVNPARYNQIGLSDVVPVKLGGTGADSVEDVIETLGVVQDSEVGVANGVASLDATGMVPSSQLPSFVDDVMEFPDLASFPPVGEASKIYVAKNDGSDSVIYRWSGSTYIVISNSAGSADTAVRLATARTISLTGDVTGSGSFDGSTNLAIAATIANDSHTHAFTNLTSRPTTIAGYGITDAAPSSHVGSGGTSHADATTTVAGFMSAADKVKLNTIGSSANVASVAGKTGAVTLVKADVGLASVDNTADTAKAVASAAKLTTARSIAGVPFDGTVSISIPFANLSSRPTTIAGYGITDALGLSGSLPAALGTAAVGTATTAARADHVHAVPVNVTGNAGTATKLATARTINGVSFDGSANVTINAVDSTARVASSEKGVANGVATLDASGLVPTSQLPSFVDDVLEFATDTNFPITGETGKIYVALDTNKTYRWSGTVYVYITSGAVDSVAGKTGVVTLVKADVGLSSVDNTADAAKAVLSATKLTTGRTIAGVFFDGTGNIAIPFSGISSRPTTLAGYGITDATSSTHAGSGDAAHALATTLVHGFMSSTDKTKLDGVGAGANVTSVAGKTGVVTLSKSDVGLSFVDNTADSAKAVLSATKLTTARTIAGVTFDGTINIAIPFSGISSRPTTIAGYGITDALALSTVAPAAPGTAAVGVATTAARADHVHAIQTTVSGNAGTATKLATARTINGVAFDGTANVTINAVDSTARIAASEKGAANGVATLDSGGKIPTAQLPAFVDDVLEYLSLANFPATGTAGIIYVAQDTNKTYRWAGSSYIYITSGAVDSVAGKTGVVTLVKADVGLGSVDNTADSVKAVASAAKFTTARTIAGVTFDGTASIAIPFANLSSRPTTLAGYGITDATSSTHAGSTGSAHGVATTLVDGFMAATDKTKLDNIGAGANVTSVAGKTGIVTLDKTDVGLDLVDNTADAAKAVLSATKLTTARTIAGVSFDGTVNIGIPFANLTSKPTTLVGYGITDAATSTHNHSAVYQPLDADLTAIVGLAGTVGLLKKTAANTWALDTTAYSTLTLGTAVGAAPGTASAGVATTAAKSDHVHPVQTTVSGNAGTATKLATARTINGVSFDGSANVTINAVDATARIAASEKGAVNGVATLDAGGKVPSAQLPAFVDDVLEYVNLAGFPATGETGKIYVALDTNKTYRWSGTVYIYITSGAVDSVAGKTGVVTLVKADVGLGSVDNTADSAKNVLSATKLTTARTIAGVSFNGTANIAIPFSGISSRPTTIAGYGITDAAPSSHVGSGGTSHALATTGANGFMSAADKAKLNAIEAEATSISMAAFMFMKMM